MKKIAILLLMLIVLGQVAFAEKTITLHGNNRDFNCHYRSLVKNTSLNPKNFVAELSKINFSPECLNSDLKHFIETTDNDISGFFYGVTASGTKGINIEVGLELVITVFDRHTLMAGLVKYGGGGVGIGLPLGASITTGALHGDCKKIDDYLGNFHNFSFLGLNKSFGSTDMTHFKLTNCNASSNTDGLSMTLIGYSVSNYLPASEFVFIKGERVEELINFINLYHPIND